MLILIEEGNAAVDPTPPHDASEYTNDLKKKLLLSELRVSKGILSPGEESVVRKIIRNGENVGISGTNSKTLLRLVAELKSSSLLRVASPSRQTIRQQIGPGQTVEFRWTVKTISFGKASVSVHVRDAVKGEVLAHKSATTWVGPAVPSDKVELYEKKNPNLIQFRREDTCLTFVGRNDGYGVLAIDLQGGDTSHRLAMSRYLGRVVYEEGSCSAERVLSQMRVDELSNEKVVFRDAWVDADGTRWKSSVTFRYKSHDCIQVTSRLNADRVKKLLVFECPFLLVGEGGHGRLKDSALLPGLDWLEGDERSSNPEILAPPYNDQHVPHPNSITVPVIGVMVKGYMIGMTWDPLQRWDGESLKVDMNQVLFSQPNWVEEHDRPSIIFASPNWVEGHDDHLMGLFVPFVPRWVKPNEHQARPGNGYEMKPFQEIKCEFSIIVGTNADVLTPVRRWYALNGIPSPPHTPLKLEEALAKFGKSANERAHAN